MVALQMMVMSMVYGVLAYMSMCSIWTARSSVLCSCFPSVLRRAGKEDLGFGLREFVRQTQ